MFDPAFLQTIPLLGGLTEAEAIQVGTCIIERRYRPDQPVFHEGAPGRTVYFLRSGKVKISRVSPSGREFIIGVWGSGSPFGLIAALDGGVYPAGATALVPSEVWALPVDKLQRLAEEIPALKASLMVQVGMRIRLFQDRVYEHHLLDTRGKLASLLLTLARSAGVKTPRGIRVAQGLTHRDLGAMLGASRETISRMLGDLQRRELIDHGPSGIVIIDMTGLREVGMA